MINHPAIVVTPFMETPFHIFHDGHNSNYKPSEEVEISLAVSCLNDFFGLNWVLKIQQPPMDGPLKYV